MFRLVHSLLVVAAALIFSAQALGATFPDGAGDATGGVPDLTGLAVDAAGGNVTFTFTTPGVLALGSTHRYEVRIDSDNNPDTGNTGIEDVLVLYGPSKGVTHWKWDGTAFVLAPIAGLTATTISPLSVSMPVAAIGDPATIGVKVRSLELETGGRDDAPDSGTFTVTLRAQTPQAVQQPPQQQAQQPPTQATGQPPAQTTPQAPPQQASQAASAQTPVQPASGTQSLPSAGQLPSLPGNLGAGSSQPSAVAAPGSTAPSSAPSLTAGGSSKPAVSTAPRHTAGRHVARSRDVVLGRKLTVRRLAAGEQLVALVRYRMPAQAGAGRIPTVQCSATLAGRPLPMSVTAGTGSASCVGRISSRAAGVVRVVMKLSHGDSTFSETWQANLLAG